MTTDEEKVNYESDEHVKNAERDRDGSSDSSSEDTILSRYSEREKARIRHKVDRRLVSICGLMYCISLLDRSNLANAAIAGMTDELVLDINDRYSIITLVFFITYVAFQAPATVLTRKIGPRTFLSAICFFWGAVTIGFGFAPNWETLLGLRMVLGILEAGYFPGAVYLLSTWYSRYDMAKRYAVFYIIGVSATGVGGLLAYGITQMDGIEGLGGWRWIFIIEGVLTCVVGILGYIFLLSFPDQTGSRSLRFLKPEELRYVIANVNKDRGDVEPEPFQIKKFLMAGLDLRIWGYAIIFGSVTTVSYALAYFLPIILQESLGFKDGVAQCLVAPPYAFAGIVMFTWAFLSDRFRKRGVFMCINACTALIGLPILGFATTPGVRYFGIFLATAGANANIPLTLTYQANNIRGQWKRAFCSASLVGMGGIGGIIGSTVFREEDFPEYRPGLGVSMGANVLIIICVVLLSLSFRSANKRADRGGLVIAGDPTFRYTY